MHENWSPKPPTQSGRSHIKKLLLRDPRFANSKTENLKLEMSKPWSSWSYININ